MGFLFIYQYITRHIIRNITLLSDMSWVEYSLSGYKYMDFFVKLVYIAMF